MSEEVKKELEHNWREDLKQRGLTTLEETMVESLKSAFRNFEEPVDRLVGELVKKYPATGLVVAPVWAAVKPGMGVLLATLLKHLDKLDGKDSPKY